MVTTRSGRMSAYDPEADVPVRVSGNMEFLTARGMALFHPVFGKRHGKHLGAGCMQAPSCRSRARETYELRTQPANPRRWTAVVVGDARIRNHADRPTRP